MSARTSTRAGLLAVVLLALVVHGLAVWHWNFLCDDAFISYRFAKNLAAGAGLCFNPGVEPPVEGYSNLLWVLLAASFEALGLAPGTGTRVVSVAASYALLLVVARFAAGLVARRAPHAASDSDEHPRSGALVPVAVAAFGLALHPAFAVWSTSGLETLATTCALFVGFERLARDPARATAADGWLAGLALAAASLLRADGAALAGLVLVGAWLAPRFAAAPESGAGAEAGRSASRTWARNTWRAAALLALVVAANLVWRRLHHGDWVPNTAHAKVSLSGQAFLRGGLYVGYFVLLYPVVAVGAALALLRRRDALTPVAVATVCPLVGIHVWYLLMGGDYMAFGRLLVPAIPFAAVALAVGALPPAATDADAPTRRSLPRLAVAALALLATALPHFGWSALPHAWLAQLDFRFDGRQRTEAEAWNGLVVGVERGSLVGRALRRYARPEDSLVAGAVGAKAYYSEMFVYDRHGLVTREVAQREAREQKRMAGHARSVTTSFFLPYAPTVLDAVVVAAKGPRLLELPGDARAEYALVTLRLEPGGGIPAGQRLEVLVRRGSRLEAELRQAR